nr:right-handed parallel beta-helix repeat-containing protein [Bacteroidota bacterium]
TSSLKNCTIEKAEGRNILSQSTNQPAIDSCLIWNSGGIGLYCYYSSLSVGNSIIINNQTGIRSDNGQPTFTNCEINSNEQQELYAVNPNGFPTFVNSTISTSAKNESIILVGGGQQTISRSWPYFDGDYVVLSTITLWHNDIPTITIAPGNTIKFSKDTKIDIAYPTGSHNTYRGRLWAEGTADMPITFTALNDSAGGWDGLSFNQSTSLSGAASSLKHCIIEKASGFNVKSQYTSQPAIDSCIFRNSTGFGLQIYYASPVITNSQIIDNSSYGIYLSGTCSPTIGNTPGSGCDLFDNGIYDIYNNTTNNINARHNFWNTLDSALVAHRVYDKYDNSGLGEVYFYPFSYEGFNSLDTLNQINGKLMYANADSSSMPNTKLYIITEANVVKDSTTTDINGNYFFTGLSNSFCQFTIPNYFGGVNSTDALMILQHFAHVINLEGINLLAADVNGSNTVNSTDALFVMKRFVHLIDEFPVGDWIMRPDIYPLILYNDTVQSDLLSLCYGDVDASFISGGKRDGLEIEMIHETEMVVNSWQKYRIPVRIKKDALIGAVSLELLYPENCLDISRASLMSNQQQMISYSNNGTTRLAWADLSPLAMNKDDLFIELTVETKDLSTQRGDISIGIGLNSEMVNPEVNIIQDVVLSIPLLVNNENESRHRFDQSQDELFMSVHPNPFRQQTTIEYTVPEGGRVLISIQKIDHSRKIELLNQSERAGNHQFVFDGAQYPEGIYLCTIQISTGNNVWFDSEKLMLKR